MNVVSIALQDLLDLQDKVNTIPKLQKQAALAYGYLLLAEDNSHNYTTAQTIYIARCRLENLLTPEQREKGIKMVVEHLKNWDSTRGELNIYNKSNQGDPRWDT